MTSKNIVITKSDFEKLDRLLNAAGAAPSRDRQHLEALREELDSAHVADENSVLRDVVTMNSRVRIKDLKTRQEFTYEIVFPRDADPNRSRISVLAPIGTALLGYRAGDTVEWEVPSGIRHLRILKVEYQPEPTGVAA